MSLIRDTVLRQWHMIRAVPRYPLKVTVKALCSQLHVAGFEVTERTVQRDLVELSGLFPLMVDDREKPYGWSWQKDAPSFDLPGLTVPEALTWVMVEQQLLNLLPGAMSDQLHPYFKAAHSRLDTDLTTKRGATWLNKVRTVPPAQPLLAPRIDPEVQRTLSDALFFERQVEIGYRKRGADAAATYRVHPLALIQRGGILYLYVRFDGHADLRMLAMHRIESCTAAQCSNSKEKATASRRPPHVSPATPSRHNPTVLPGAV